MVLDGAAAEEHPNKQHARTFAFLCFSSEFFVTHFSPAVNAARLQGFALIAFLPTKPKGADDLLRDVTIVLLDIRRARFPLLRLFPNIVGVASALRHHRPDVVQAFSLQACFILALTSIFVSLKHRIFTITGLGLIDVDKRWLNRLFRPVVYWLLRALGSGQSNVFVFENPADPVRLGIKKESPAQRLLLMGAGVDPCFFVPTPLPALTPLRIAVVSRMIWTKGIDLAVQTVSGLVTNGAPIQLDLYGGTDPENPQCFPEALLKEWSARPGIFWHGKVSDIRGIWRRHHVGLFASRGGEGLPRAMLEAAACGRALLTTDVSGCSHFVRSGVEGLVVRPNSVSELESAIDKFLTHPELLQKMGDAARRRLMNTATEEIVTSQYAQLFASF